MVSYRVAQASKHTHTIAETRIEHCVTDIVGCLLNEKSAKQINTISFSNNTVKRRINDLSNHIKTELIS